MAAGFIAVFGGFGLLTVSAAATVQRYLPYVTIVIGIALVALGIWLLTGHQFIVPAPKPSVRWAPTARIQRGYESGAKGQADQLWVHAARPTR